MTVADRSCGSLFAAVIAIAALHAMSAADLPLPATRVVKFTTDEGTWMSLDVSPDAKTIVFDLLGDLYTIPIDGGEAKRLTSGPAFDSQPRYSPDGKTIVYTSDLSGSDNVWLIGPNGESARPLTRDDNSLFVSPTWMPDGRSVVVSKRDFTKGPKIHLVQYLLEGGSGIELTAGAPFPADSEGSWRFFSAAIHPTGKYLFASFGGDGLHRLVRHDLEAGSFVEVSDPRGNAMRPVLSPDGRRLVYATRDGTTTGLKLRDLETGAEQWLARGVQDDMQTRAYPTRDLMPGSAFVPDGSALLTAHHGKIWRIEVPSGSARVIPFNAAVEQRLAPLDRFELSPIGDSFTVRQIRGARPSPDGRKLVFTALDRLWLMDLPNGQPRRLTPETGAGEHAPVWSPDGRFIAYVTWSDLEGGEIYRVAADGQSAPVRLSRQTAFYHKLAYSPDGTRLLAVRESSQAWIEALFDLHMVHGLPTLVWLPAEGGPATEIAALSSREFHPRWFHGIPHFTTAGDRIYFRDARDGLVSIAWSGGERRVVLRVTEFDYAAANEQTAQEIIISPTGDKALALVNDDVYLIALPRGPSPTVQISVRNTSNATVPATRVPEASGAEFLGWQADGKAFYYSIGRSFFSHPIVPSPTGTARTDVVMTVPGTAAAGTIAMRHARVVTMRGDEVIADGDVVVRGGRIAAVGSAGSVPIPADAAVFDVRGTTIIPGLLDVHDHTALRPGIHRTQSWQYRAQLAYGITTCRDPQTDTTDILTYADLVESGRMLGPRQMSTGPGIFNRTLLSTIDDATALMARYGKEYGTGMVKEYFITSRKRRQLFQMAAREQKLNSTAEGVTDFRLMLTLVLDGYQGIEHSFPMFPIYRDVVELVVRSGTINTPTLVGSGRAGAEEYYYSRHDVYGDPTLRRLVPKELLDRRTLRRSEWYHDEYQLHTRLAAQYATLARAGAKIGSGGHGMLPGLATHWSLWALASGGMHPHDVLRVGTIWSAEAIGASKDLGSLEVGKVGDLVVLNGNPLESLSNTTSVRYVMKDGRLYESPSLKEVWPTVREPEAGWWEQRSRTEH